MFSQLWSGSAAIEELASSLVAALHPSPSACWLLPIAVCYADVAVQTTAQHSNNQAAAVARPAGFILPSMAELIAHECHGMGMFRSSDCTLMVLQWQFAKACCMHVCTYSCCLHFCRPKTMAKRLGFCCSQAQWEG